LVVAQRIAGIHKNVLSGIRRYYGHVYHGILISYNNEYREIQLRFMNVRGVYLYVCIRQPKNYKRFLLLLQMRATGSKDKKQSKKSDRPHEGRIL
jgi:hypothetical protein